MNDSSSADPNHAADPQPTEVGTPTAAVPSEVIAVLPTEPKSEKKPWWRYAFGLSGWIVALAVGVLDLPSKIEGFRKDEPTVVNDARDWWYTDKTFTGLWSDSDEGEIALDENGKGIPPEPPKPNGPVILKMTVYGNDVSGEIWSQGLDDNYAFSLLDFDGYKRGGSVYAVAWDLIGGNRANLARFRIDRVPTDGGYTLRMTTTEQGGPFLPASTELNTSMQPLPEGDVGPAMAAMEERIAKRLSGKKHPGGRSAHSGPPKVPSGT